MAPPAAPLQQHHDGQEDRNKSQMKSLSELPHEVLVVLMQHVPLQQRLQACARLSSKFRRAAAAATTFIKHHAASISTVYSLDTYLQLHGSAVISLDLKPPITAAQRLPYALQRLPCPGLLRLELTDTLVQLTAVPGSQQPGILASCPGLTCLSLLNCNVLDSSEQLGGLSVLQVLRELVVQWGSNCSRRTSQPLSLLPGSLLSQLVSLTRIHLAGPMRFASLEHLSCVTGLQQFRAWLAPEARQESFTGVSRLQRLTSLSLLWDLSQQSMGFNETPGLYQLTTLQALDVWACKDFRPSLLQQMSGLRSFVVRMTALPGGAGGTRAMLKVLPLLSGVTQLCLTGTLQHPAARLDDYTTLACLSKLGVLVLSECFLPAGLWQQLVETGMPMRSVWYVDIRDCHNELLDTGSLSSLVKFFPALQHLSCERSTKDDIDWTPLQQLPDLQAVHLSGVSDAIVPLLTSLQLLTQLKIQTPSTITDLGLLRLTALTQLWHLEASGSLSDVLTEGGQVLVGDECSNLAPADQRPNVAKELMRLCMRSSACQPVLLEQLEELQQQLQDAQDELDDASAEIQAREAAAAAFEQQLQGMDKRLKSQEQSLKDRNKNASAKERSIAVRSWQVDAEAKAVAALQQQLAMTQAQLNARAQQLAATEAQLTARAQTLDRREYQLNQGQSMQQPMMQAAAQPMMQAAAQPVMQVPPWRLQGMQQQQPMMQAPHAQQQPLAQAPHAPQQPMAQAPYVQQQMVQVQPMMQGMMAAMQQGMMQLQQGVMQVQQNMGQAPYMYPYN